MTKRFALTTLLLVVAVLLAAQYDEKEIMMQRAQGLEMRQQYTQANVIYAQLADDYPGDVAIVTNWVRNLLRIGQDEEAAEVLAAQKPRLPAIVWTKLSLQVQLKRGDVAGALDAAVAYLEDHPQEQSFQEFANIFSGYQSPEEAAAIYRMGRKKLNNDGLFTLQLARALQQARQFGPALDEYLKHLRSNRGYLNYTANQLRPMLDEDRRLMDRLARLASDDDEAVRELVALGYVHLGEMDRAFEIYRTLNPKQLKRFADEQFALDNLDTALRGYRAFIEVETHPWVVADAKVAVAGVYRSMGEADSTRAVLLRLYDDETLRDPRIRQSSRAPQLVREMLAELAMESGDYDEAERYYQEAIENTPQPSEREITRLRLTRLQVLLGRYDEADRHLASILDVEKVDEKTTPDARYIRWFSLWLREDAFADSVLNTMVIKNPERAELNDALMLTLLCIEASEQSDALREAMRLHGLRQTSDAVNTLKNADDPRLLILAGDWAYAMGRDEQAHAIFDRTWEDADNAAFAALRLAQLDEAGRRQRAADFLNQQPSHPFSPLFRRLLGGGVQ